MRSPLNPHFGRRFTVDGTTALLAVLTAAFVIAFTLGMLP